MASSPRSYATNDQIQSLLSSVADPVAIQYREEISKLLSTIPMQVNHDALDNYGSSAPSSSAGRVRSHNNMGCGPLPGATLTGGRMPQRGLHPPNGLTCKVGESVDNAPHPSYYSSTLELPSLYEPYIGGSGGYGDGGSMGGKLHVSAAPSHVFDGIAFGSAERKSRISKKPLAQQYQERVSARQNQTPHIFSDASSHVRSGFNSIETKSTKKFMPPQPPELRPCKNLTDISGVSVPSMTKLVPSHRYSGAPTATAAAAPPRTFLVDVSPIEVPRTTLASKIRETLLYTGQTIQSMHSPRKIPTAAERFEASYKGLAQKSMNPALW